MTVAEGIVTKREPQRLMLHRSVDEHIADIAQRNLTLISPHMRRVATLAARIATTMGYSLKDCMRVAEGGLFHDIGKNHVKARAWLAKHRGVDLSPDAVRPFRVLHSKLGQAMVIEANLRGVISSSEDLALVCRCHHHHYRRLIERMRRVIAPIQVADSFDAATIASGEHCHGTISPAQAIEELLRCSQERICQQEAVNALVLCESV